MKILKSISVLLVVLFLASGVVLADKLYVNNDWSGLGQVLYDNTNENAGKISLLPFSPSKDAFTFGFCLEPTEKLYIGATYDYTLVSLSDYRAGAGLIAADILSKGGNSFPNLNLMMWNALDKYSEFPKFPSEYMATLSSNYAVAVINGAQDLLVNTASPVPEPASMMLFGTGCVVFGGYLRRKLKK